MNLTVDVQKVAPFLAYKPDEVREQRNSVISR